MNDQISRMMNMSGESGGGKAPKYNVPIIKFNGNTGEFSKLVYTDGMKETFPLSGDLSFVILKNRKRLEAQEAGLSSVEFNSTTQIVTLFSNTDGKFSKEAVDTVTNLRASYPVLKTQEVLYVLFEGEICKLIVKGGSSAEFYTYKETLAENQLKSFMVTTTVKSESAKGKLNKTYFKMKFSNSELTVSLDEIESKMTEVAEAVAKIDEYNSGKALESNSAKIPQTDKVIDYGSDEIDVDEISLD